MLAEGGTEAEAKEYLTKYFSNAVALPGSEVLGWNGLLAPAGTPAPIIARLNEELRGILAEPEIRRQLAPHGTEPAPTTPEEFGAIIHADIAKWGRVVREAGINPD